MSVKLLTEHQYEFQSLKEGCTGSSESTLVKIPHCWKSHVTAICMMRFSNNLVSTNLLFLCLYFSAGSSESQEAEASTIDSSHGNFLYLPKSQRFF